MDDDETQSKRTPPDILLYEERADTRTTRHLRTKSKITKPELRGNIRHRIDAGAEIVCVKLAVAQMTRGEWECWIALKEGVLFDPLPKRSRQIVHRTWFIVQLPAKTASVAQVVAHYHYTERSVREMDRHARQLLVILRLRAGLIGEEIRVPIWPAVCSDNNLLAYLYGNG